MSDESFSLSVLNRQERFAMVGNETQAPVMVTPSYARTHLIRCGKTKFYAMVKAGSIRLVDVGVGRRMVDVASIKALVAPEQKAAA